MRIFETHLLDDPRIPFILLDYTYCAGEYLGFSNWHENVELLYITSGRAVVTVNSVRHELSAGEVAIINSNHIHDIYAPEDMHFYCLIIDRSFCLSNHIDTNDISFTTAVGMRGFAVCLTPSSASTIPTGSTESFPCGRSGLPSCPLYARVTACLMRMTRATHRL